MPVHTETETDSSPDTDASAYADTASGTDPSESAPVLKDVAVRLADAVGRIDRKLRPTRAGVSYGSLSMLSGIMKNGPLRPRDLAKSETVAAPTITRVIADLENRGLVQRSPDPADGRSFFVSVTQQGIDVVLQARSERAARAVSQLRPLDEEQRAALASVLDALDALVASR